EVIISTIKNFSEHGRLFGDGARNVIKIFPFQDMELNIKSFKVPNIVNRVAYRFVRKSKAERSYNYAHRLLEKGVGTPRPIAYAEEEKGLLFGRSFYVSEHLKCDLTFRTLVQEPDYPEREKILRAFTRFTFS